MYLDNCIFCKIAKGEIPSIKIWEDEKYLAFLDVNSITPGHTLLIPKSHTDYIFDLEDGEYCELTKNAKKIATKLKSKLNSKRIGLIVEGFLIPHVHIHLVPINNGHELNRESAKPTKKEDLEKVAKIINS